jgi:transposase
MESQFPPYETVFYYFRKWTKDLTLELMNDALNRLERVEVQNREDSPSLLLVDAQSVRLDPRIGADRGIDGGKNVNGRKRSILTDSSGKIWRVNVHAANIHDGIAGKDLIYPDFTSQMSRAKKVLGDSAYGGQFAALMAEVDTVVFECPKRAEGTKGFVVEAKRWVVERTFAWFNFYRRITKDHERTVESSESFILMANIQMNLLSLERAGL